METTTGPEFEYSLKYIGQGTQTNHLTSELQKVWYSNGQYSDPHYIAKK